MLTVSKNLIVEIGYLPLYVFCRIHVKLWASRFKGYLRLTQRKVTENSLLKKFLSVNPIVTQFLQGAQHGIWRRTFVFTFGFFSSLALLNMPNKVKYTIQGQMRHIRITRRTWPVKKSRESENPRETSD